MSRSLRRLCVGGRRLGRSRSTPDRAMDAPRRTHPPPRSPPASAAASCRPPRLSRPPAPDRADRPGAQRLRRARRRAGARGRARRARRPARFARRPDRDQGERRRSPGSAWTSARGCSPGTARRHSAYLVRRLRDAGFVVVGHDPDARVRDPAHDGAAPRRARPQPVGPLAHAGRLLRRLGRRGRRGARPARARQRRRRLPADPGRVLRPRRPQAEPRAHLARPRPRRLVPRRGRRAHADGRRVGAAARRARRLRGRRRDVGAAPGRAVHRGHAARRPGRLRIAMALDNALGVECRRRTSSTACTPRPGLLRELGHEVEEAAPPVPEAMADLFIQAFAPHVALGIGFGERLAGRPAEEDEIEPLSRAVRDLARALPSTGYLAARGAAAVPGPRRRRLLRRLRPAAHAGAGPAAAADRRARRLRRRPGRRAPARGAVRAVHAALQRHRPAGDQRPDRLRRRRAADGGPARRATRSRETRCCRWRRRWRRRGPWAGRTPPL